LTYIYASPHFESPDSITHIAMIKWISEHNSELPIQSKGHNQLYGQQASQPPLYYFLMMPVWSVFDTSDFDDIYQRNFLAISGNPSRLGNRNLVMYQQPHPPYLQGTSLAIYAMRLITLMMSTVTVIGVFQSARTILPDRLGFAVLATSFTAFNPQFLFIGASVSNDNLVTMLATLITWQMLIMLRDGFQTRRSLILAVLITFATLTKLNGLVLVLVVALAGLWVAYRTRNIRGLIILGSAMLGFWLVVGSWWYIRNIMLYDELFGTGAMIANYGKRSITFEQLITLEGRGFLQSYWGLFGWFSIFTNEWHYRIMDGVMALSLVGLIPYVARFRKKTFAITAFGILSIMAIVGMVMLIWWTSQTTGSQGRLIFPYIVALSILMAMGLHALRIPALVIALPMMIFSMIVPFVYIVPEYDHPPQVDALPETAIQTFAQWDNITLIGYDIPSPQRWQNGDEFPITLYWKPLTQTQTPHAFFITLINDKGEAIATLDSYPGWGSLLTTQWQPNTIYKDDYVFQILDGGGGFSSVQLQIGWYEYPDGSDIRPILENGQEASAYTIPFGVYIYPHTGQEITSDPTPYDINFEDTFRLTAYRLKNRNSLILEWQLLKPLTGDWRVFAFILDKPYQDGDEFEPLFQMDAAPRVPLHYLKVNELVRTTHTFDLPDDFAGQYIISFGWYNAETGERLPIPYPAHMYSLEGLVFDANAD
jgi:4-amino-4-deoxy-L-arabinose transferase-like glycosyltransferase